MSLARTLLKLSVYQANDPLNALYSNNGMPNTVVTSIGSALDYIVTSMFPNARPSVATEGDLPPAGNQTNDYRIVLDYNSTGQAAGYRWYQQEGQATEQWNLVQLFDSQDSILQEWETNAAGLFALKEGVEDVAGQVINGSSLANGDLTLSPNSGDGTNDPDLQTGFIKLFGVTKPTHDNKFLLGTSGERFASIYLAGELSDGTNAVTVLECLTAYNHSQITSGNPHSVAWAEVLSRLGDLEINGDVSTVTADLSTGGNKSLTLAITDDSHNHTVSTITDFNDATWALLKARLTDTDTIAWSFNDGTKEATGNVTVDTGDISDIAAPAANKMLAGNAAGDAWIQTDNTVELTNDLSGSGTYNSTTDKTEISATVENVAIEKIDRIDIENLAVSVAATNPAEVTQANHGMISGRKLNLFGTTFDGEYIITVTSANTYTIAYDNLAGAVEAGYVIPNGSQFIYDSLADKWRIALENASLSHYELQDLGGDDHSQYHNINGRTDGSNNALIGGEVANGNLYLESTSHATKGDIRFKDNIVPETGASYVGSWQGTDVGKSGQAIRNIFMRGTIAGLRLELQGSLPTATIEDKGRLVLLNGGDAYITKDGVAYKYLVDESMKGVANGVAPLNATTKIDAVYLPSYVDDVEEYADFASLPVTGETGKIYVTIDNNKQYRWSGSNYIEISPSDVNSVNGYTGIVTLAKSDIGLSDVLNKEQLTVEAGSFNAYTEKTTPVEDDIVIIEDSADSYNKKKVKLSNMLGGGGGAGGSFQWTLGDSAPLESFLNGMDLLDFDKESQHEITALVTVPEGYTAGDQIFLKDAKFFASDNLNNVFLRCETTLYQADDLMTSATNQHVSTNTELNLFSDTAGTNRLTEIGDIDLCDASGEINSVAVAPLDILVIRFYRDNTNETTPATVDARFLKYSAAVDFNL